MSAKHHLLSWVLSSNQLRSFYDEVELVTDQYGYDLFIKQLRLPYSKVHVILDKLDYRDDLWAMAKIETYKYMKEPFLHVDGDIYIWQQFPQKFANAEIITQNMEVTTESYYGNFWRKFSLKIKKLPELMVKYNTGAHNGAFNTGLFGGNDIEFIQQYCNKAQEFVDDNKSDLYSLSLHEFNVFYEQVLLYEMTQAGGKLVCSYYEESIKDNQYNINNIADFDTIPELNKYLHLLGGSKRIKSICDKLETYVLFFYPEFYKRVEDILNINSNLRSSGYNYCRKHNNYLRDQYMSSLISKDFSCFNDTLNILGRDFIAINSNYLTIKLCESNIKFYLIQMHNFSLKEGDELSKYGYIVIHGLGNDYTLIKKEKIDTIILSELKVVRDNEEFMDRIMCHLNDRNSVKTNYFIKCVWSRIAFLASYKVIYISNTIN